VAAIVWRRSASYRGVGPDLTPDLQVLAFTRTVGITAALGAAIWPALRASSTSAVDGLRQGVGKIGRLRFGKTLVIGVVRDVKHYGVRERVTGDRVAYLPLSADEARGTVFVRTDTTSDSVGNALRAEARSLGVVIERFRLVQVDVDRMVSRERMVGTLGAGLAGLATALAVAGVYGLLAYSVGQRRRELGLRMALGAGSSSVMAMVLKEAASLFGAALVIGIPTALGFTRFLRGLVYDVPVTDVGTFVLAAVALGITACIAALIPARRAARIDPASAIRFD
jgi:putative ABC transport system permease protein